MPSAYTEDHLVEQPAIELIRDELGWAYQYCYDEWSGGRSVLGRESKRDVVLVERLRPALEKLNPDLPAEALNAAAEELCRDRSAYSLVVANQQIYQLLKPAVSQRAAAGLLRSWPAITSISG